MKNSNDNSYLSRNGDFVVIEPEDSSTLKSNRSGLSERFVLMKSDDFSESAVSNFDDTNSVMLMIRSHGGCDAVAVGDRCVSECVSMGAASDSYKGKTYSF